MPVITAVGAAPRWIFFKRLKVIKSTTASEFSPEVAMSA
jgi:hypothetical protein